MILPILISVSLAPGSYFFCALAGFAIAAASANTVKAIKLRARTGIVLSRLTNWFSPVWQVARTLASIRLFRATKRSRIGRLLARLFGPRHDLDHFAFVLVRRIGICPLIRLNRGPSHQRWDRKQ